MVLCMKCMICWLGFPLNCCAFDVENYIASVSRLNDNVKLNHGYSLCMHIFVKYSNKLVINWNINWKNQWVSSLAIMTYSVSAGMSVDSHLCNHWTISMVLHNHVHPLGIRNTIQLRECSVTIFILCFKGNCVVLTTWYSKGFYFVMCVWHNKQGAQFLWCGQAD